MSKKNKKKDLNEEILDVEETEVDTSELMAQIEELKAENEKLKEEVEIAKSDYLKAYADVENTKKRLRLDFENHNKYRLQSFGQDILPTVDNLERALENSDKDSPLYQGVEMVYRQMLETLRKEGIEEIEALGSDFDPNFHHAIALEKREGVEAGKVLEVLQKGYKLKDRVLRATMVKVSE